jgi:DNA processing protein
MTPTEALVILNMVDHIGPVSVRRLMQRFGEAQAILEAPRSDLKSVEGVGEKSAEAISTWRTSIPWEAELEAIQKHGLRLLTAADADYPLHLKQIHDPPLVLYARGDPHSGEKNSLAIVGSRQVTHYGSEVARRFGYKFGSIGMTVVSGLARGIDSAAHSGCLQAKGHTVAVLGFGFDYLAKAENAKLAAQIVEGGGAILSEFPCRRAPDRQTFPMRNRIVSGMTMGTLVIEAGASSGALITANFATDQGRQVFAVPGRIDSPHSQGCHKLIQNGAKLAQCVEDVLEEFEYLIPKKAASEEEPETPTIKLTDTEELVYSKVGIEETPMDAIIADCDLPPAVVSATLMVLEMKRVVRQLPGKRYARPIGNIA